MKSSGERLFTWPLIVGIVLGILALTAGPAFAALSFSGTSISGDANVIIDSSSTISIGTSTATGITIGQSGITTTFPGTLSVLGSLLDPNGNKYVTSTPGGSASSTNNITYLAPASSSVPQTLTSKLSNIVSVTDFGAKGDGVTNDTAAIQAAINAAPSGSTLLFPCRAAGGDYLITSPLIFNGKTRMTIEGVTNSGYSCDISFSATSSYNSVVNLVGAWYLSFENIVIDSANASNVPQTVLLLGRASSTAAAGNMIFQNVNVEGYATKALVYSVASEENSYNNVGFFLNGGGAKYVYYTSTSDDLGVDSLPTASDLSVWFSNSIMSDFSSSIDPTHSLVYIAGQAGGDSVWRDGYFASASGTAVTINAANGVTYQGALTFDSNRFENGYQFFDLGTGGGTIDDLRIMRNTFASTGGSYMINASSTTTLVDADISDNIIQNDPSALSQFPILKNSYISEDYPYTIAASTNSMIFNRVSGQLTLTTNSSSPALIVNGGSSIINLSVGSSSQFNVNASGGLDSTSEVSNQYAGFGSYQNLLLYSQFDSGNGSWTNYGSGQTITPGTTDIAAPDGSLTAEKIVAPSTFQGTNQTVSPSLVSGQVYTTSVWMRGLNGGETVEFGLNDTHNSGIVTLTNSWKRYLYTSPGITDTSRGFEVISRTAGETFYVWGAQTENSPTDNVYVRTTNAAVASSSVGLVVNASGTSLFAGNLSVGGSITCGGSQSGCASVSGGVANYVPLWTSATSLGTSTIYVASSTGHVSIGTSTAQFPLSVAGTGAVAGFGSYTNGTNAVEFLQPGNNGELIMQNGYYGASSFVINEKDSVNGGDYQISAQGNLLLAPGTNGSVTSSQNVLITNGHLGIGTTAPSTTLQVGGASSTIRIGAGSIPGCLELLDSSGNGTINYLIASGGVLTASTTKPGNCQ